MRSASEFTRAAYTEAIQQELAGLAASGMAPPGIAEIAAGAFGHGSGFVFERSDEDWSEEKAAPPIAESALRSFPVVRVTEEDLAEDGNEVCCVCIEPQRVGDKALKLSCCHLYHPDCIVQWLRKHAICPNCRYEFPTENPAFESGRKERMLRRKPRIRRRQLEATGKTTQYISTEELAAIYKARSKKQTLTHLTNREALILALQDEKLVDFVNEPKPLVIHCNPKSLEHCWPSRALKDLMLRVGVDSTGCVEKGDLVKHLLASGRVQFQFEPTTTHEAAYTALETFRKEEAVRLPSKVEPPQKEDAISSDDIPSLSVRELKSELRKRGLDHEISGCIDKDHLRRTLARAL